MKITIITLLTFIAVNALYSQNKEKVKVIHNHKPTNFQLPSPPLSQVEIVLGKEILVKTKKVGIYTIRILDIYCNELYYRVVNTLDREEVLLSEEIPKGKPIRIIVEFEGKSIIKNIF